ncbi:hypothetical protein IW142_002423 [Coemansia sp. RSA 564]|nr:hypothetical protein IW142_002423 [Coemansia sp. RSA 564]
MSFASAKVPNIANSTAILEIGANDVMNAIPDILDNKLSIGSFAKSLSDKVVSQLQMLKSAGFKNIYVANIPPLDKIPLMIMQKQTKEARTIVSAYNQLLLAKTDIWAKASNISNFAMLDMNMFLQTALSKTVTNALGISDTTNSCVGGEILELLTGSSSWTSLLDSEFNIKEAIVCSDPQAHFFWDPLHPADRVHRLFGYYVNVVITERIRGNTVTLSEDLLIQLISKHKLNTIPPRPASLS